MLKPKTMVIHGGGYVGLTAAVHYARSSAWELVVIYDPDSNVVKAINNGHPKVEHFLAYLNDETQRLVTAKKLIATSDFDSICRNNYHTIAVPSERNGEPDTSIVESCLKKLFNTLPNETTLHQPIIIVESTLTPGTIDRVLNKKPINVRLAVCPRRDWFADKDKNVSNLHRVVGGVNSKSTAAALTVLSTITRYELCLPTDYQTAELCKALENALLHIPVMFAHQLALSLPDKNVREALRLAGTHWRLPEYHIGFGTGGRCVPLGTKYLTTVADSYGIHNPLTIARNATNAEFQIRHEVAKFINSHANMHKLNSVVIFGAGYRPDFKDIGGSPAIDIAQELTKLSSLDITLIDPLWDPIELTKITGVSCSSYPTDGDIIVLATCHSIWKDLPERLLPKSGFVLDAHGDWEKYRSAFKQLNIDYRVVGEPNWLHV